MLLMQDEATKTRNQYPTHLDLLERLDVKCGEQQQVDGPRQSWPSQLGHWEGQAQMDQQHTHTFHAQHTAGC